MANLKLCRSCQRENPTAGVYCRGVYCAAAVPATPVLRAKLARFASRLERAEEQIASVLGCLRDALDVVKDEKIAGLGQLELDASTAYDIAHAVQRLIEHAQADTEDMRVAARRKS